MSPPDASSIGPAGLALALLTLVTGCSGEATVEPAPQPAIEAPAPGGNPELPMISPADLAAQNDSAALVPSPMETQRALEAAGIHTELASLIPRHDFDVTADGSDLVAVRTGVVLADLLLTTKTASKADVIERLKKIAKGMEQLGAGEEIQSSLKDFGERVNSDAVTRDDLLREFDELSGVVIPKLTFNGLDRVVPLIEAGSWLEGANLVARALKASPAPNRAAAEGLLKAPAVVDYFLKYVKTEGAGKAPEVVTKKLEESLATLKGLAEKSEPLTDADIDTIVKVTDDVLALL